MERYPEDPAEERRQNHKKLFITMKGSASFHFLVFHPNSVDFKASSGCVCANCVRRNTDLAHYSQAIIFMLSISYHIPPTLRSNMQPAALLQEENDSINEFTIPRSVVDVATSPESSDTVWFIKVKVAST